MGNFQSSLSVMMYSNTTIFNWLSWWLPWVAYWIGYFQIVGVVRFSSLAQSGIMTSGWRTLKIIWLKAVLQCPNWGMGVMYETVQSLCPNTASNVSIYKSVFNHIFIRRCQVRGIETVTTYDPKTQEFVINTPCESAQKYWIGGAANVRDILMISFHCQILFSLSFFSITVFLLMKFMMQCHLLIVLIYGCNPFVARNTYYSFLSTIYKWM